MPKKTRCLVISGYSELTCDGFLRRSVRGVLNLSVGSRVPQLPASEDPPATLRQTVSHSASAGGGNGQIATARKRSCKGTSSFTRAPRPCGPIASGTTHQQGMALTDRYVPSAALNIAA